MTSPAGGATAEAVDAIRKHLLDLLIEANEGKFELSEIDPAANFLDYGYIDSLTGVVFLAEIEERYGIEIDDLELVERLNSIDALAVHVAERNT
jgi:acyl carrier protein